MQYDDFMKEIQLYYGLYPEKSAVPSYVLGYLQRDIDELKLDRLFRFVTYHHPHRFGAPGIAEIEKSISEALYKHKGEDVHSANFTPKDNERPNTLEEDIKIGKLMKNLRKDFDKRVEDKLNKACNNTSI